MEQALSGCPEISTSTHLQLHVFDTCCIREDGHRYKLNSKARTINTPHTNKPCKPMQNKEEITLLKVFI